MTVNTLLKRRYVWNKLNPYLVQEYKPPSSKDIPIDFRVDLLKNAPNPIGILGSKGVSTSL